MTETHAKSADGKSLVVKGELGSFTPDHIDRMIAQLEERKAGVQAEVDKWKARKAAAKTKGVEGAK